MNKSIRYYLAGYNFLAFTFWLAYFIIFSAGDFKTNASNLALLNIAQGLAILEILHVILKWVRSPVLSTAAQVFSRILIVALIDISYFSDEHYSPLLVYGIIIVSVAWSITELVRYSFYFLSLFDRQPQWLLWMRYTLFIVLYPLGVTGEWMIIVAPLIIYHAFRPYTILVILLAMAYIYYFPVLYKYMWRQRKARLGPGLQTF